MRTLMGFCLVLIACGGSDDDTGDAMGAVTVGPDWVPVHASCGYSFDAPPDATEDPAQGIDSCVNRWNVGTCVYWGDYGAFSSDLSEYEELPDYRESQRSIAGRSAKLVTARSESGFIAAAQFSEVGGGARLTVWATCADESGQQEALAAWGSIRFDP
jgi:hypothetical protein